MKSLLTRGLACAVLLCSSVLAYAQYEIGSIDTVAGPQSRIGIAPLGEYSTRTHGFGYDLSTGRPEYGQVRLSDAEINRRIKDDEPPAAPEVQPRVKPASEKAARDQFYRSLHRHADGRGTLQDVEDAYQDLLPYRR